MNPLIHTLALVKPLSEEAQAALAEATRFLHLGWADAFPAGEKSLGNSRNFLILMSPISLAEKAMDINTNSWNRFRYTLYSPAYDLVGQVFSRSRQRSVRLLDIHRGDRVLLIGAGTGLDLPYLPTDVSITATDLTPSMVKRLAKRGRDLGLHVKAQVMDGQKLELPDQSYDKIILHLILAVIPDPVACLREAERVLAPGGRIVVFDKFVPAGQKPGVLRRLTNNLTTFLFSDITRSIEDIASRTSLRIIRDEKADFGGSFRIILLGR